MSNVNEKITSICFDKDRYDDLVELHLGGDFELKTVNGKVYVRNKHVDLPKTFAECCAIMGTDPDLYENGESVCGFKCDELIELQKLLICRSAYWKVLKNWAPDFKNDRVIKYAINVYQNQLFCDETFAENNILIFPTRESRDTFYNNFLSMIEFCKELL